MTEKRIRVAVNGYGVIGKRIADAVGVQDDMELAGIADITSDWRLRIASEPIEKKYRLFRFRRTGIAARGASSGFSFHRVIREESSWCFMKYARRF